MEVENKNKRKPKVKHYGSVMHLRIREDMIRDIETACNVFRMTSSELGREAISQYIGRLRSDYPDKFKRS